MAADDEVLSISTRTYDNLEANRSWISVHAVTDGVKTIELPLATNVCDIIANRFVGKKPGQFQVEMKRGETGIFMLGKAPKEHGEDD